MKKQICYLLISVFFNFYACEKTEEVIDGEKPTDELFVAGYLPHYGMSEYDLQTITNIDRVYYFSVTPDANGDYFFEDKHIRNLQKIKNVIAGTTTEVFLVIGGWYESETIFPMASDPKKMEAYTDSVVQLCIDYALDGIDLDWEAYPSSVPVRDYTELVNVLGRKLSENNLKFTVAVAPSHANLAAQFINKVDQINLMSYGILDEHGQQVQQNMLQGWLDDFENAGVPRSKLIVGVPFYAKRPYDANDDSHRSISYLSIVNQSVPEYNENSFGKYAYNGRGLLTQKTILLRSEGYHGIMAWELTQDCAYELNYSLLNNIVTAAKK